MKKILLVALIGTTMISCKSETEQVKIAKEILKKEGYKDFEVDGYTYSQTEVNDKDVYMLVEKKYKQNFERASKIGDTLGIKQSYDKQIELLTNAGNATGKKFFKVEAVQLNGVDTLHHKTVYLDDKNEVIDVDNRK